jgi:hypothetical protein
MCSYANRETVEKALGIYNSGNEQKAEVKYICVNFVVDDDEMVPFPEFFEDIQNLLHADLLHSPEELQVNRSIYTIVRNIIAWYVDKDLPSMDEPKRPKYAPHEGKGSSIIWALTIFLYGIDEPETRTALINLELAIMKGQESAKKVSRELEVEFDENGGILTPAIRRMQTRNNSVSSTPPISVAPVYATNSNQELVVALAEVKTGEKTSPVDEMVATKIHALVPPPLNSSYDGGSSSDYSNSRSNRSYGCNGNDFVNNASDRRQSHFSGEQHQDRRTDPVKLTMAMSAHFSSKHPRSQNTGGPNETSWIIFRSTGLQFVSTI